MKLDELEALERAATPGPWQEFAESGEWWVRQALADGSVADGDGYFICKSDTLISKDDPGSGDYYASWRSQGDLDLALAARNALPALLRVARAAQIIRSIETRGGHESGENLAMAREELDAALAALEATP